MLHTLGLITLIVVFSPDIELYNRLTIFHEFPVLDKASKDKAGTSGVKFCFNYQPKSSDTGTQYY